MSKEKRAPLWVVDLLTNQGHVRNALLEVRRFLDNSTFSFQNACIPKNKGGRISTDQNKAIVRKDVDALSRGDMARFVAGATDGVSFTLIGSTPSSGTIQGKQNIEKGRSEILGDAWKVGRLL